MAGKIIQTRKINLENGDMSSDIITDKFYPLYHDKITYTIEWSGGSALTAGEIILEISNDDVTFYPVELSETLGLTGASGAHFLTIESDFHAGRLKYIRTAGAGFLKIVSVGLSGGGYR